MLKKVVSVIVPVYNEETYLPRCIESILAQTYSAIEIILVDDGSTDGSGQICDRYEKDYSHITALHIENSGAAQARNAGLLAANGEWIQFADADDWLVSEATETLVNGIYGADWSVSSFYRFDGTFAYPVTLNLFGLQPPYCQLMEFAKGVPDALLRFGSNCNKLYWREIISRHEIMFENTREVNEDAFFNLAYADYINCVRVLDEPLYYYNIAPGRNTMSRQKRPNAFARNEQLYEQIKKRIWNQLTVQEKRVFFRHYLDKTLIVTRMLVRDFSEDEAKRKLAEITRTKSVSAALADYYEFGSQENEAIELMRVQDIDSLYQYAKRKRI